MLIHLVGRLAQVDKTLPVFVAKVFSKQLHGYWPINVRCFELPHLPMPPNRPSLDRRYRVNTSGDIE
jgi:hypothetical protein